MTVHEITASLLFARFACSTSPYGEWHQSTAFLEYTFLHRNPLNSTQPATPLTIVSNYTWKHTSKGLTRSSAHMWAISNGWRRQICLLRSSSWCCHCRAPRIGFAISSEWFADVGCMQKCGTERWRERDEGKSCHVEEKEKCVFADSRRGCRHETGPSLPMKAGAFSEKSCWSRKACLTLAMNHARAKMKHNKKLLLIIFHRARFRASPIPGRESLNKKCLHTKRSHDSNSCSVLSESPSRDEIKNKKSPRFLFFASFHLVFTRCSAESH